MKKLTICAIGMAVGAGFLAPLTGVAAEAATFKNEREKASYAVGLTFGNNIKRAGFDLDLDVVNAAMREVLADKEPRLTEQQARETIMAMQQEARKKMIDKNRQEGETFLAANKTKPGVKTHPVSLPDGSTAEIQYKVITDGTGATPKSNDMVTVHYRGTLINGKEFDSSAKRGEPAKFAVNRVIKGWTAALQLMKVGSKWEVYIPASLAYGDNGTPSIEPASTLIFEVELLGVEASPPPPAATGTQPLTSDIIRVPSAEELKKGAKIEVIKPEDAARMQQEAEKAKK